MRFSSQRQAFLIEFLAIFKKIRDVLFWKHILQSGAKVQWKSRRGLKREAQFVKGKLVFPQWAFFLEESQPNCSRHDLKLCKSPMRSRHMSNGGLGVILERSRSYNLKLTTHLQREANFEKSGGNGLGKCAYRWRPVVIS